MDKKISINKYEKNNLKEIVIAGGCFWGVEAYFQRIDGIMQTEVGYANGEDDKATYDMLFKTGHAEVVKLIYDEYKISLKEIIEHLFKIIDPFSLNKQGLDIGKQYRTGVYSSDADILKKVKQMIDKKQKLFDKKIRVEVLELKNYVKAENYHQNYLNKNPGGYCHINLNFSEHLPSC